MNDKIIAKVNSFFDTQFVKNSSQIAIFKNPDGSYELFDKYLITGDDTNKYTVSIKHSFTEINFASLRNAVTWCIFEKRNLINELRRIVELDLSLEGLEASILRHETLLRKTKDIDTKVIYSAKLSQEKMRKKALTLEINVFIENSKNWQTKKFAQR